MQNKFTFTGTPYFPKADSKRPFIGTKTVNYNGETKEAITLNLGIKESDNNMAFVDGFDSPNDAIFTFDTDNQKIEIDWEDRLNPDIIKQVAYFRRYIVDLGNDFGGRQEFITQYDMMEYLRDNLPNYKGKITVMGSYTRTEYKGVYYDRFRIQNVYAAEEDKRNRLGLTVDFYYNKDSVDKSDFLKDKKIYLDGYISQYINKDEGNKYIPMQLIFNATKYDMENKKHKALYDYKMKYIDIKNKNIVHLAWEVVLARGAEEVEFTLDMLTENQKQQVELGIRELDDFKPKGKIIGGKINEFRLFEPLLLDMGKDDDFRNGLVELQMKMSEFEEEVYIPNAKEEKIEEKAEEPENPKSQKSDEDDDSFDLF